MVSCCDLMPLESVPEVPHSPDFDLVVSNDYLLTDITTFGLDEFAPIPVGTLSPVCGWDDATLAVPSFDFDSQLPWLDTSDDLAWAANVPVASEDKF
jgi:hypothetical protein